MNVELRIYKRFDTDLYSLHEAGYSLTSMIVDSVKAYANGTPLKIVVDEDVEYFNLGNQHLRLRAHFSNTDRDAMKMLDGIKPGYRNTFCKQVLRNALASQNLGIFFMNNELRAIEKNNRKLDGRIQYPNVRRLSEYKKGGKQLRVDIPETARDEISPVSVQDASEPVKPQIIIAEKEHVTPSTKPVAPPVPPRPITKKPEEASAGPLTEEELLDAFDNL